MDHSTNSGEVSLPPTAMSAVAPRVQSAPLPQQASANASAGVDEEQPAGKRRALALVIPTLAVAAMTQFEAARWTGSAVLLGMLSALGAARVSGVGAGAISLLIVAAGAVMVLLTERAGSATTWSTAAAMMGVGVVVLSLVEAHRRQRDRANALEQRTRDLDGSSLLEHAPDIVARFDRQYRHLYVNGAVTAATGLSPRDFMGRTNRELGQDAAFCRMWERQLETVFLTRRELSFEFDFATPAGHRWYAARFVPEIGADGALQTLLAVTRDVTDARATLAALHAATAEAHARATEAEESRRLLDALMDNINEGITITSGGPDFRIERVSRYALQCVGRPLSSLLGVVTGDHAQSWGLADADGRPIPREKLPLYRATRLGESISNFEMTLQRADGTPIPVLVNAVPVRDASGAIVRGINCWREITELKQTQAELADAKRQAEQASAAKDQFLAVLSHELRTPLTPVMTLVQMLEADPALSEDTRQMLATVRRNLQLEVKLIDDLLDLTRIAAGKLELQPAPIDVHRKLRDVLSIVDADIHEKGLQLQLHLADDLPRIYADPARLQQVLWNLLKNAVKFTPTAGHISVHTARGDGVVIIDVQDSGVGIDPPVQPRLFRAFEQGGIQITRKFGGLGLGLAISKAIVEHHKGRLSVHSEGAGRGARFTVELPIGLPGEHDGIGGSPQDTSARDQSLNALSILLVEDHPDTAKVMAKLLSTMGCRVHHADSVAGALQAVSAQRFDLLISDLGLPDGNGYDLMRQVRMASSMNGIALSGYGREEDVARSMEAGFAAHLTKPIDITRLRRTLQEITVEKPSPQTGVVHAGATH